MKIFNKKKFSDFFIYGFGQAINIVSPLLVMPYLIKVCGAEGLGKIGVGFSLALILNGIIDYGSYINGVKEISINRFDKKILEVRFNAIYLSKLILILLLFVVVTAMFFFIPFFAKDKLLFFLSLSIVVGQLINPAWFFQGVENFKLISIVNIASKVLYLLLVFFYVTQKQDYILANLFLGIGAIIANGLGLLWLLKEFSFSFRNADLKLAVAIIRDEFTFSLSQFFLSVYQFFPIIIISYISGDLVAGQFRIVDQIVSIFKTYLNMFFYFVYANICFELNNSVKKGISVWKQYNGLNFILLLAVILLFYINTDLILQYFKVEPQQIAALSKLFQIGLLIPVLVAVSQPLRQLLFAFEKQRSYVWITIIGTILNVVLLVFLTNEYGLKGAFFSIIFIELIIIVLYCCILYKHSKENLKLT